jgi:two-component system sensor histidine kinase DevS
VGSFSTATVVKHKGGVRILSDGPSKDGSVPSGMLDYRAVFEAIPDGIVVVDQRGRIVEVNPSALSQFGYSAEELIGEQVETLVPESHRAGHDLHRAGYSSEPVLRPMGAGLTLVGRRKDGSGFPVEISLSPWKSARGDFVIGVIRDQTERMQLRAFGQEAIRAAEEERRRISRELHDDTAQRLATLLIHLRLMRQEEVGERREEMMLELREGLQEVAEGVRRIARGLRPPALEDAGLVAALRAHIRNLFENQTIRTSFDAAAVDPLLTDDGKLVLYRVVQEALSNVVRHSGAATVNVAIHEEGSQVIALVEDDGTGFDAEKVGDGAGLGLVGMEERAAIAGGSVRVDSAPGGGTRVRLSIPQQHGEGMDG